MYEMNIFFCCGVFTQKIIRKERKSTAYSIEAKKKKIEEIFFLDARSMTSLCFTKLLNVQQFFHQHFLR